MMQFIKQTKSHWAVLLDNDLLAEGLTTDELVAWVMDFHREELKKKLETYDCGITWEEALIRAGRIKCCDCLSVCDCYNPKWPLERQRCSTCLQG